MSNDHYLFVILAIILYQQKQYYELTYVGTSLLTIQYVGSSTVMYGTAHHFCYFDGLSDSLSKKILYVTVRCSA